MKFTTKIANLKTEFSVRNATNIAGRKIMLAYLEKIKLDRALHALGYAKASNSLFPTYRILLYLIVGWMIGCERIFHFKKLQKDSLLRRFLGGRCPEHTLLYKELKRLGKCQPALGKRTQKTKYGDDFSLFAGSIYSRLRLYRRNGLRRSARRC